MPTLKPSTMHLGYCLSPVTVYIKGPIKGYIYPYYYYYPTVTEWGQDPTYTLATSKELVGVWTTATLESTDFKAPTVDEHSFVFKIWGRLRA